MIILQKNRTGKLFLRSTALLTLVLFSWTTVSLANPGILAPALPVVSVVNPGSHFAIPAALGTLQETHFPADFSSQSPLIIHIQDVHALPEAQRKIENLIRLLQRKYGFSLLLLEGAQTRLDPQLFHFFNDPQKNLKMADYLLKNGEFSGPERFLLKQEARPGPAEKIQAEGIEDENFYRDNLAAFKRVYAAKEEADWFLGKMEARVEKLSTLIWKPSLRKFAHAWKSFHREKTEILQFLKILRHAAQKELNIDLGAPKTQLEYPHLVRIFTLDAHSPELDAEKLTEEKARLLDYFRNVKLKDSLIRDFDRRVRAGVPLAKGKKELRGIFEEVYRQAPKDFSFRKYPEIALWGGTLILREELRSRELMAEAEEVADKIFNHAAQSQEQKELAGLWKDLVTLEKLFSLELIRTEYRDLLARKEAVEPVGILKRIKGLEEGARKFDFPEKDLKGAEVEKIFHQALEFYRGTERREQKMAENTMRILKSAATPRAILITGGFHSEGLKEAFKTNKIGYMEISPALQNGMNHRKNYLRSILGREAEESHLKNPAYIIPRQAQMNLGADLRSRDAWIDSAYQMAASLGAETRVQGHSLGNEPNGRNQSAYHFRVDSILQSYNKIYLLYDPASAQYKSRPYEPATKLLKLLDEDKAGEIHIARLEKLRRALEYLKARADELGDPAMRGRAEKIGKSTTVIGVDMPTRLLFYRQEDRTAGVYHIGRRRSTIYFPLLFLDSIAGDEAGIEELGLYLDRAQRWIEAYHESTRRIEQEGLPAETIYELMDQARANSDQEDKRVLKTLGLDQIFKRLDALGQEDEVTKKAVIDSEISDLTAQAHAMEDSLMQRQVEGNNPPNRDDYFDLSQFYGRLAHLQENVGSHQDSLVSYHAQTDVLRDIQRVDKGHLPLEMQEGIARILLRTGLYEEFLKELNVYLTGQGFPRRLTLREKNILSDTIIKSGKIFEPELQYILLSHQEGASKEDLAKIRRVSEKIRELFAQARQRVEAKESAGLRLLPRVNIVPVVTPLTPAGEVDGEGIKKLVKHLVGLGVEAVLVMGATGEFHMLENDKRLEAIGLFREALKAHDTMLFANVTGDTEEETLRNIRAVENSTQGGVDAFVIAPLYYLKSSAALPEHLQKIKTSIPLVLYNNPGITGGQNIDPAVLPLLKGRFIGLKDSSGDMSLLKEYAQHTIVYQGDETQIVPALEAGARGGVSSMGNVFRIDLFGEDVTPAARDQIQAEITAKVPPLTAGRKKIVAGLKYYLSLRGIIGDTVAPASPQLEEQEKRAIEGMAASLGSGQSPHLMDSVLQVLPQEDQERIVAAVKFVSLILRLGSMNQTRLEQFSGHKDWINLDNIPGEKILEFFNTLRDKPADLSSYNGDWEEEALRFLGREHEMFRDIKLIPQWAFRIGFEVYLRGALMKDKSAYVSAGKFSDYLFHEDLPLEERFRNAAVLLEQWGILDLVAWTQGALDRVALYAERQDGSQESDIAKQFLEYFVSHLFQSAAMTHAFMFNRSIVEGFLAPDYAQKQNVGVVYLLSGGTHLYQQALQVAQKSGADIPRLKALYVNRKILEGDTELLKEYLRQQGIPDYDTLVLVDTGFHGTVAKKIADLLAEFQRAPQKIHTRLLAMSEAPYSHGAMEAMGFNHLLEPIGFLPDDKNRAALNLITHLLDTALPAQDRSPVNLTRDLADGSIQPALKPTELPVFAGIVRDEIRKGTEKLLHENPAYPSVRHPAWDQWLPDGAAENIRAAASLGVRPEVLQSIFFDLYEKGDRLLPPASPQEVFTEFVHLTPDLVSGLGAQGLTAFMKGNQALLASHLLVDEVREFAERQQVEPSRHYHFDAAAKPSPGSSEFRQRVFFDAILGYLPQDAILLFFNGHFQILVDPETSPFFKDGNDLAADIPHEFDEKPLAPVGSVLRMDSQARSGLSAGQDFWLSRHERGHQTLDLFVERLNPSPKVPSIKEINRLIQEFNQTPADRDRIEKEIVDAVRRRFFFNVLRKELMVTTFSGEWFEPHSVGDYSYPGYEEMLQRWIMGQYFRMVQKMTKRMDNSFDDKKVLSRINLAVTAPLLDHFSKIADDLKKLYEAKKKEFQDARKAWRWISASIASIPPESLYTVGAGSSLGQLVQAAGGGPIRQPLASSLGQEFKPEEHRWLRREFFKPHAEITLPDIERAGRLLRQSRVAVNEAGMSDLAQGGFPAPLIHSGRLDALMHEITDREKRYYLLYLPHLPEGSFKPYVTADVLDYFERLSRTDPVALKKIRRIVAESTGNQGRAVAAVVNKLKALYPEYTAQLRAVIFVPFTANPEKVLAMQNLGALVVRHKFTDGELEEYLAASPGRRHDIEVRAENESRILKDYTEASIRVDQDFETHPDLVYYIRHGSRMGIAGYGNIGFEALDQWFRYVAPELGLASKIVSSANLADFAALVKNEPLFKKVGFLAPAGSGGLESGIVQVKQLNRLIQVFGTQVPGVDPLFVSLERDEMVNKQDFKFDQEAERHVDGIAATPERLTFEILRQMLDGLTRVPYQDNDLMTRLAWSLNLEYFDQTGNHPLEIEPASFLPLTNMAHHSHLVRAEHIIVPVTGRVTDRTLKQEILGIPYAEAFRILKSRRGASLGKTEQIYQDVDDFTSRYLFGPLPDGKGSYRVFREVMEKESRAALYALDQIRALRDWMDKNGAEDRPLLIWQNMRLGGWYPVFTSRLREQIGIEEFSEAEWRQVTGSEGHRYILIKHKMSSDVPKAPWVLNEIREIGLKLRAPVVMVDHSHGFFSGAQVGVEWQEKEAGRPVLAINTQQASDFENAKDLLARDSFFVLLNANPKPLQSGSTSSFDDIERVFDHTVTVGGRQMYVKHVLRTAYADFVERAVTGHSLGDDQVRLPITVMGRVRDVTDQAKELLKELPLPAGTASRVGDNLEAAKQTNAFDNVHLNLLKAWLFFSHSRENPDFENPSDPRHAEVKKRLDKLVQEIEQLLIDILVYRDGYAPKITAPEDHVHLKPIEHLNKILAILAIPRHPAFEGIGAY